MQKFTLEVVKAKPWRTLSVAALCVGVTAVAGCKKPQSPPPDYSRIPQTSSPYGPYHPNAASTPAAPASPYTAPSPASGLDPTLAAEALKDLSGMVQAIANAPKNFAISCSAEAQTTPADQANGYSRKIKVGVTFVYVPRYRGVIPDPQNAYVDGYWVSEYALQSDGSWKYLGDLGANTGNGDVEFDRYNPQSCSPKSA